VWLKRCKKTRRAHQARRKAPALRRGSKSQEGFLPQRQGFKTHEFVVIPPRRGPRFGDRGGRIDGAKIVTFGSVSQGDKRTLRCRREGRKSHGKMSEAGAGQRALETLKFCAHQADDVVPRAPGIRSQDQFRLTIVACEVVRDLIAPNRKPEQSYSERQL